MKHSDPLFLLVEANDADPERGAAPADSPRAQALMERILAQPRSSHAPAPAHTAVRRLRGSWPARLAAAGASVAVVAVAAVSYSRLPTDEAPTEVAVASGVTGFVVPSGGCTVRNATPQEAARATSFLTTEDLPLYRVDAVRTSGCPTYSTNSYADQATPVATYLRVVGDDLMVTGALTLWSDVVDARGSWGPTSDIAVGSEAGKLVDVGDGRYAISWEEDDGTQMQITASGVALPLVLELAETFEMHGSTDALPTSVDGLELVDVATAPHGPATFVDLSYTRRVEDETTGEATFLTLRPKKGWEASISTAYPTDALTSAVHLVDIDGALGMSVNNGSDEDPSITLIWDLPSGQTAMLWGSGDTASFVELAENLETATATDPRIVENLNQRAPFIGR